MAVAMRAGNLATDRLDIPDHSAICLGHMGIYPGVCLAVDLINWYQQRYDQVVNKLTDFRVFKPIIPPVSFNLVLGLKSHKLVKIDCYNVNDDKKRVATCTLGVGQPHSQGVASINGFEPLTINHWGSGLWQDVSHDTIPQQAAFRLVNQVARHGNDTLFFGDYFLKKADVFLNGEYPVSSPFALEVIHQTLTVALQGQDKYKKFSPRLARIDEANLYTFGPAVNQVLLCWVKLGSTRSLNGNIMGVASGVCWDAADQMAIVAERFTFFLVQSVV